MSALLIVFFTTANSFSTSQACTAPRINRCSRRATSTSSVFSELTITWQKTTYVWIRTSLNWLLRQTVMSTELTTGKMTFWHNVSTQQLFNRNVETHCWLVTHQYKASMAEILQNWESSFPPQADGTYKAMNPNIFWTAVNIRVSNLYSNPTKFSKLELNYIAGKSDRKMFTYLLQALRDKTSSVSNPLL